MVVLGDGSSDGGGCSDANAGGASDGYTKMLEKKTEEVANCRS